MAQPFYAECQRCDLTGLFFLEATEAIQLIKMGGYWLMLLSVVLLALSHFHPQGWVRTLTTEVRTHELASDSLD